MSDLARWELRGPVRTLRTQFAEWNPEAGDWWPLKSRFVATFRVDGQLSEIEHHNPDRSVPREVRVYDDAGRLSEDLRPLNRRQSEAARPRSRAQINRTSNATLDRRRQRWHWKSKIRCSGSWRSHAFPQDGHFRLRSA